MSFWFKAVCSARRLESTSESFAMRPFRASHSRAAITGICYRNSAVGPMRDNSPLNWASSSSRLTPTGREGPGRSLFVVMRFLVMGILYVTASTFKGLHEIFFEIQHPTVRCDKGKYLVAS